VKNIYDWSGLEEDCPQNIVILASKVPLILQAEAHPDVRIDSPRIEQGDRRQGDYYVKLIGNGVNAGLQRLVDLAKSKGGDERVLELEKIRQIRTGERPPQWVVEARQRSDAGHEPSSSENIHDAMTRLSIASRNW
jgi:hypothetical protein